VRDGVDFLASEPVHGQISHARQNLRICSAAHPATIVKDDTRVVAKWVRIRGQGKNDKSLDENVTSRLVRADDKQVKEILVVIQPEQNRVTDKHLERVHETSDVGGFAAIGFTMTPRHPHRTNSLLTQQTPPHQPPQNNRSVKRRFSTGC
jgi:hypothetical protein